MYVNFSKAVIYCDLFKILKIIKIFLRWSAFLLYFGYSPAEVKDQKPLAVFKMVIEFALEYRTNRDKILQMRKRMQEKRERNKTRGMMIGVAQGATAHRRSLKSSAEPTGDGSASHRDISDREVSFKFYFCINKIFSDIKKCHAC